MSNLFLFLVKCDCWRIRDKRPSGPGWQYRSGKFDAVSFQTDGDVILQGYRLWGLGRRKPDIRLFPGFDATIRLYRNKTLIAEKTKYSSTISWYDTFEVHFSQEISILAGVTYIAAIKITPMERPDPLTSLYHDSAMRHVSCSGVNVTFTSSPIRGNNGSNERRGQIPALIFRAPQC